MSNHEKQPSVGPQAEEVEETGVAAMEISDEASDEGRHEAMMREIVLGIPAMRLRGEFGDDDDGDEDDNAAAAAAAAAVAAAAAAAKEKAEEDAKGKRQKAEVVKGSGSGSGGGKQPKKVKTTVAVSASGAGGSGGSGEAKPKKKAPELTNPPPGPPTCPYCGRLFDSWKAVFGHLRTHKERQHQGFLPPPRFSAAAEGIAVGGSGSGSGSGSGRGGGGGDASWGSGARGLGIDLNAPPPNVDEATEEPPEENVKHTFDLNRTPTPPKEEDSDEEDKA